MFIAHLPAGYLLSHTLKDKSARTAIMVGSLIPDIDLLYFYTLSDRAVVHHNYWTHIPSFWLLFMIIVGLLFRILSPGKEKIILALSLGALLHLALDSIAGSIFWLAPFHDKPLTLVQVPALYHPWQLNFILHWTFTVEIIICIIAAFTFLLNRKLKFFQCIK